MYLSGNSFDDTRHIMVLNLTVLHPKRETTKLAVISVIRHQHLRADQQNLAAMNNNTAIVDHILVHDRPICAVSVSLTYYQIRMH